MEVLSAMSAIKVGANHRMGRYPPPKKKKKKKKEKMTSTTTTYLSVRTFHCFILSVQSLEPKLKQEEMDNGYHVMVFQSCYYVHFRT